MDEEAASGGDTTAWDPTDLSLTRVLDLSRELGFLGTGPIDAQVLHAMGFLPHVPRGAAVLDLGSGGGLPGLVIARARPDLTVCLLDAMEKRCRFLDRAVEELGLGARVMVQRSRAEELAQRPAFRARFDVVTARSFGPPAVTLECAAGFLRGPGSLVLVSEPPESSDGPATVRWPSEGTAMLGMTVGRRTSSLGATIQVLTSVERCADQYPRRVGIPSKRPLF
jgi:16S rRNA (guanine527-N7)-methyltransferase